MSRINYDQLAQNYARNRRLHPEVFKYLLSYSQIEANSRVLEIGCGTANYITAIKSALGCWCGGVDQSAGMVFQASQKPETVRLQLGKAGQIGLVDNTFDLLFSVDVIHHLTDYPAYFQDAFRLLKTGAKLCTATESEGMIRHRHPLTTYFPEMIAPETARYPRITELEKMMHQCGFTSITQQSVEFEYEITDIQPYADKAFSSLHLISEQAFQAGLARLRQDLAERPIQRVTRQLLLWGTKIF